MLNKDEYETRLDGLRGECRSIQENLEQEMFLPDDAYRYGSADWCRRLARTLDSYRFELDNLADEFDWLEEDLKAEPEPEDEDEDEDEDE